MPDQERITAESGAADWTVLLIGGASTTGKSTLAAAIGRRFDARVIEADLYWLALQRTVPPEVEPDLHFFPPWPPLSLPVAELVEAYLRVSAIVCRALEVVVAHHALRGVRAVVEGTWLLPSFAAQATFDGKPVGHLVTSLFLFESSLDAVKESLLHRRSSSFRDHPPDSQATQAAMHLAYGNTIKQEAEALNLRVVASRPLIRC